MAIVLRVWLALAVLTCSVARGQAPSYSAAGVANAWSYGPAPFAPNSVVSIFGTNLAFDAGIFTAGSDLSMPLDSVKVYVDYVQAPLLMVSQGQINFIIPSTEIAGSALIQVVRQGVAGPAIQVPLVTAAPTLYPSPIATGYATAEDWNNGYALITPDAPARAGDTVVLFATGLGAVQVAQDLYSVASLATSIADPSSLKVLLGGTAVDPTLIKYVGLTPGCAGLYQINLLLPATIGNDPSIQIAMGGQSSQPGLSLAVR